MRIVIWSLTLFLVSCQPSSLEDFRLEGLSQARLLLQDLRKIERREDFVAMEATVKRRFDKLVDLMIQARQFQRVHPDKESSCEEIDFFLNEALLQEFKRIYTLEGGREYIEKAAKEAMLRLDAKERALERKKAVRPS